MWEITEDKDNYRWRIEFNNGAVAALPLYQCEKYQIEKELVEQQHKLCWPKNTNGQMYMICSRLANDKIKLVEITDHLLHYIIKEEFPEKGIPVNEDDIIYYVHSETKRG
jgi:hypothetical protein